MKRFITMCLLVSLLTIAIASSYTKSQAQTAAFSSEPASRGEEPGTSTVGTLSSITLEPIAHAFVGSANPDTNYGGKGYV